MLENRKLRLRFIKEKRAVYSSHLDLMRTMQRAFLRAGLPLKYSEGFNPHALISILLPLSLGMYSGCELMDFQMREDVPFDEICQKLNSVLPEGVEAIEVYSAQRKVRELKYLTVEGALEYDRLPCEDIAGELNEFFSQENIVIEKKTKRGIGQSDIAPAIKEVKFDAAHNEVKLYAVISAQEPTLNPENMVNALRQLKPELAPDFAEFRRIEVHDADMKVFR